MDASVIICTYNRADRLARVLDHFKVLKPAGYDAELIVVDNRSTDGTAETIARASQATCIPIVYAYENRQGKSFALNHALKLARGDILALTDDDVIPGERWLDRIVHLFRTRDITFASGKVLPLWEVPPDPAFLTRRAQAIWGPLALVDYGDEPFDYTPEAQGPRLPVGANLAFRRHGVARIGGWRNDLGKVNNTLISGEDHEIFIRLLRAHEYRGTYAPDLVVYHDVPERLRRAPWRRGLRHRGGRYLVRMRRPSAVGLMGIIVWPTSTSVTIR